MPARVPSSVPAEDSVRVSVLTFGPGEMLFDRFGHMAIRVRDSRTGLDSAYNWGMYDFNSPNFIGRFLTGETQYWMAGFPTALFVDYYRRAERSVWEQDLALDRVTADSLVAFLRWNAQPANKFYRYDYYLDNCATRVRDVLDQILGGGLKAQITGPGDGRTWRDETLRLAAAFPSIGLGMTFALGRPADVPLTKWEMAFIPMHLRDQLRSVRVGEGTGARPLVVAERALVENDKYKEQAHFARSRFEQFGPFNNFLVLLYLLGFAAVGLGALRPRPWARWGSAVLISGWHLFAGLAGTLVLLAGTMTRHTFMAQNPSVLLGTPVSLLLVLLIPLAFRRNASERTRKAATAAAVFAAIAALSTFGFALAGLGTSGIAAVVVGTIMHVAVLLATMLHIHYRQPA